MSTSRSMRKSSRMSSPMNSASKGSLPAEEDGKILRDRGAKIGDWEEPPLRNPAPSFEDYKGLERHGVLEHMAPLGALPNQKVRLRLKAHDSSRRLPHVRNGDLAVTREEVNPSDSTPPVLTRRSESRKMEDRPTKLQSSRERDEDQDYLPKGISKTTPVKANPSQPSLHGTPSSRTSAGQARLRQVVDSAVERANELGNPVLGLAVKKLFDESLHNRTLADLLDAVLSQKPTARQAADFQGYIKVARKQIKAENDATHSPLGMRKISKSMSKSPSKSARPSIARHTGTARDLSDATGVNDVSNSAPSASKNRTKIMEGNGSITKTDRPAKRLKRSKSASSLSSLSSLSSMDQDFTPTMGADQTDVSTKVQASIQPTINSSVQPLLGPKLHTFATVNNISLKRTEAALGNTHDDSAEEVVTKRRKLDTTFDDYAVNDSGIRASPKPKKEPQPPSFPPSLVNLRTQQPRLRNGTSQRTRRDDNDDLQSPGSSAQSELLIPPPAGAQSSSRGVTPNHLGRPLKQVKKAARIKMS
ncbi:hypothetical protein MMC07_005346 [Pseudocyphellaria aurata]|nr:hypothetical protein [Pseudocyphellaria aurata]